MATLSDYKKHMGDNVSVKLNEIQLVVDGDIEYTVEREVYEWKPRGKAITLHIPSKRVTISGTISGVPTSGLKTVLQQFLGTNKVDEATEISGINDISDKLTITFENTATNETVTLSRVVLKNLKYSAKEGEPERVEFEFYANAIE